MIDREIDWSLRWKWSYIPPKFWGQTLDDLTPQTPSASKAKAAASAFVASLPERLLPPPEGASRQRRAIVGVGMSIIGSNGMLNTELACAIITTAHRTLEVRPSICYVRADQFVSACVTYANAPRDDDEREDPHGDYQQAYRLRKRAAKASVTVLDALGREHRTQSGFAQKVINNLLHYRYEKARPTVVTSQEPHAKWALYDPALPSFASEAMPMIPLIGTP